MAIQVQRRRGTAAENAAFTGAEGEYVYLTDTGQIAIHDGSTQGGFIIPNEIDGVNDEFGFNTATGTDTIVLTVPSNVAAYQTGQVFTFKAANTITGTATLNVNTLGAKTIRKKDPATTSVIDLAAADIIAGGIYTVRYDGTYMQLISNDSGGISNVSQGDLNTSNHTFSLSNTTAYLDGSSLFMFANPSSHITLTGGEYGLSILSDSAFNGYMAGWLWGNDSTSRVAGAIPFMLTSGGGYGNQTVYGSQRYITSSPPFDLGDGETNGFLFLLYDDDGNLEGHSFSEVPPWVYNGPTKTRCDSQCLLTKKKYNRVAKKRSIEAILDGAPTEHELREITNEIKNKDMAVIPHPFGAGANPNNIVMIDPMDKRLRHLVQEQDENPEFNIGKLFADGTFYTEDKSLKRAGPEGIKVTPLKYKKT